MLAPHPRLSATPGRIRHLGSAKGQDTDAVLRELLGYDDARIDRLREMGQSEVDALTGQGRLPTCLMADGRMPSACNTVQPAIASSDKGQHIELGIAEMNLFLLLGAAGLSHSLFGKRLIPIGTLYDPFVMRGLDALNYACYMDARFMVVGTP
jgi:hypothetical protein